MRLDGPWKRAAAGASLLTPAGEVASTIFGEITDLANRTGAVNLGQGFPDYEGPAEILDAAVRAIRDGVNQYPPARGTLDLRRAIAEHHEAHYGIRVDPESEVLVTAGATEALAATILALVEPGEDVVVLEPHYDAYGALAELADARLVTVPLQGPDFALPHEELRRAVSDRTRLILVNTPHNPTGVVLSRADLELVVELAQRHDAIIVADEVYEHLTFEKPHVPVASIPGASTRTLSIGSGGKTFSTTGWKIGWITGPAPLVFAVQTVKQFLTYVNGAPFQPATAVGLRLPASRFDEERRALAARRDRLLAVLDEVGFAVRAPEAGYFVVADAAPLGWRNAQELCLALPELAGVAAIPVSALCSRETASQYRSLARFAFCKSDAVLDEAARRLRAAAPKLRR